MKLHYGNKFFSVLNKFKLQFFALLILVLGIAEPMFFLLIFPFGGFACLHFLFRPRGERKKINESERRILENRTRPKGSIDGEGYGKRGGRYYERTSKNGNSYRQYY